MDTKELFDKEWEILLECESRFKDVTERYATGQNVNVSEVDDEYVSIKKSLKRIRKLAKKVKKDEHR